MRSVVFGTYSVIGLVLPRLEDNGRKRSSNFIRRPPQTGLHVEEYSIVPGS
jgi:hypothetical protein